MHRAGRAARRILEDAREAIAARFGASPAATVFTSGGTEADALAVHALTAAIGPGARVITGATEHDAVRAAAPEAAVLPVDAEGVADLDALETLLTAGGPALVCLMLANNETGAIQPIAAAAAICRRHGAYAACRRGAGRRADGGRSGRAGRRHAGGVIAQVGRSAGCRRAAAGAATGIDRAR